MLLLMLLLRVCAMCIRAVAVGSCRRGERGQEENGVVSDSDIYILHCSAGPLTVPAPCSTGGLPPRNKSAPNQLYHAGCAHTPSTPPRTLHEGAGSCPGPAWPDSEQPLQPVGVLHGTCGQSVGGCVPDLFPQALWSTPRGGSATAPLPAPSTPADGLNTLHAALYTVPIIPYSITPATCCECGPPTQTAHATSQPIVSPCHTASAHLQVQSTATTTSVNTAAAALSNSSSSLQAGKQPWQGQPAEHSASTPRAEATEVKSPRLRVRGRAVALAAAPPRSCPRGCAFFFHGWLRDLRSFGRPRAVPGGADACRGAICQRSKNGKREPAHALPGHASHLGPRAAYP